MRTGSAVSVRNGDHFQDQLGFGASYEANRYQTRGSNGYMAETEVGYPMITEHYKQNGIGNWGNRLLLLKQDIIALINVGIPSSLSLSFADCFWTNSCV